TVALAKDLFPNTFSGLQDGVNAIGQINYTMKDARLNALEFINVLVKGAQQFANLLEIGIKKIEIGAIQAEYAWHFTTGSDLRGGSIKQGLDAKLAVARNELGNLQKSRETMSNPDLARSVVTDLLAQTKQSFQNAQATETFHAYVNSTTKQVLPVDSEGGKRLWQLQMQGKLPEDDLWQFKPVTIKKEVQTQLDDFVTQFKTAANVLRDQGLLNPNTMGVLREQFGQEQKRVRDSFVRDNMDMGRRNVDKNLIPDFLQPGYDPFGGVQGGFLDRTITHVQGRIEELKREKVEVPVTLVGNIIQQIDMAKKALKNDLLVPVETITGDQIKYIQGLQSEFDTVAT
ncbi:MAG: hypothetical protein EBR82_88310, partial [Caulobacteraceae bacterium]|nr:hypothetical protein [Caulobacteraceae bacterium]